MTKITDEKGQSIQTYFTENKTRMTLMYIKDGNSFIIRKKCKLTLQ